MTASRAVVLGGGAITGIAWEAGVLAGLRDAGVDLAAADAVIGTSAGAFVGVALAGGHDMAELLGALKAELPALPDIRLLASWNAALREGGADRRAVGAAFGRIALRRPEPVPRSARRAVIEARLVSREWPASLRITATDADTGELHVLDRDSGMPLVDAVTASGAVPGVWPLHEAAGRRWIDGGMASTANAHLAAGFDRVVVLAPLPEAFGRMPSAAEDVAALPSAELVTPDDRSAAAIGPNVFDPTRIDDVAAAGRAQGAAAAGQIARLWSP